ncbi:hypothetical protein DIZ27_42635 [Streptomyces sp. NWU339]|uniref:hypothetical protein n=1 Tax=Streptomyces sp. NWU339 TaxID=2185284 RepID=UPI000D673783|nr:hypothetical protein [Streptomyces sp. NWU339]PWI04881.1 hypothetical protein DIZ27_42635 [Streptomyces sp. NWU339]
MKTRPNVVTAAVAAAAALAVTGITYASASAYEPAQAAPAVQQAAAPAAAPLGGESGQGNEGRGFEDKGNEGRGFEGKGNEGRGFEGKDHEGRGFENRGFEEKEFEGRIHINERSFSARPDGCITVVSGLGANSFNIRNDSKRTVEFFRGATCDNGAPVATVGPHSEANGIKVHHTEGVRVKNGVVGSFRVVHRFGGHGGY